MRARGPHEGGEIGVEARLHSLTSLGHFPIFRANSGEEKRAGGEARERSALLPLSVFGLPKPNMKVIVLGAGVIGTATAWYLAQAGHEVEVVERREGPGPRDLLRQRRPGLRVPRRAVGRPGRAPEDPALALARRRAAALPPAHGPGAVALGPALPPRVHRVARAREHRADPRDGVLLRAAMLQELRAADRHRVRRSRRAASCTTTPSARSSRPRARPRPSCARYGLDRTVKTVEEAVAIEPALAQRGLAHRGRHLHAVGRVRRRATSSRASSRSSREAKGVALPLRPRDPRAARHRREGVDRRGGRGPGGRGDDRGRRVRRGAGQLQRRSSRGPLGIDLPDLSGQGLLGHASRSRDADKAPQREPHRRRGEDRDHAAGRAAAHRGHGRALRLVDGPEPGALRGAGAARAVDLSRGRRLGAPDVLGGPSPRHAVERAARRRHAHPEPLAQHRPRHARLDHGLRLRRRPLADLICGRRPERRVRLHSTDRAGCGAGSGITGQWRHDGHDRGHPRRGQGHRAGRWWTRPACTRARSPRSRAPQVYLKFENHQFTASFKERGALNKLAVARRRRPRGKGVIACSAGNHAQGVAYHAARLGIPAVIVMPRHTPFVKVEHTRKHGAEVILHGEDFDEAKAHALALERSARPHPRASLRRREGHRRAGHHRPGDAGASTRSSTCSLVAVGGGGLIAGIATAAKALKPGIEVVGVETDALPVDVPRAARHRRPCSAPPPSPRASR